MTTLKQATLINAHGCHFDKIELSSIKKIKEWARGRGGAYLLDVDNGLVQFKVKNSRFYKI